MKRITYVNILVAMGIYLGLCVSAAHAESIRYCEDVSKALEKYSSVESVYEDMILKTRRKAAELVFQNELNSFDRDYFTHDEIIDSILPLVEFDDKINKEPLDETNAFNVCVTLKDVRIKLPQDRKRFEPKDIAEICHFDAAYVDDKIQEINDRFIDNLKLGNISRSIGLMLSNPDNLKAQTYDQLNRYTYTRTFTMNSDYLSDLRCKALYLHPIDLYVASSAREVSAQISVLPPVVAKDDANKEARFQVIIIHRDYNWKKGSNDTVVKGDEVIVGFKNTFKNPRFVKLSKDYLSDIVSLGMASCEGSPDRENKRALARSKSVLKWVKGAFKDNENGLDIYGVNLGKHKFAGVSCRAIPNDVSASQRTILLVGILKGADEGIDLNKAMYNAMKDIAKYQPEKLPISPKDYLLFDVFRE